MTLEQLQNNLERINLDKIEAKVLKDLEPEIIELNQQQLEIGENQEGELFPEYSSLSYVNFKQSIGSKSGEHYDLKVTGDFYNSFTLVQINNNTFITATDEKTDRLLRLTGGDIFGLQDQNIDKLNPKIIRLTCQEIKKQARL